MIQASSNTKLPTPKTSNIDRIANPESNHGLEVVHELDFSYKDVTQDDFDMLTPVLKRMIALIASDRADVAELLNEPWFQVEFKEPMLPVDDSNDDEVASPPRPGSLCTIF